jgi:hypothetical protein
MFYVCLHKISEETFRRRNRPTGTDRHRGRPDSRRPRAAKHSVSIYTFFSQYGDVQFGQLAAYSMLYSLPVVVLFLILSRKLGGAFALGGAIKG